jgi:hypothetical protein
VNNNDSVEMREYRVAVTFRKPIHCRLRREGSIIEANRALQLGTADRDCRLSSHRRNVVKLLSNVRESKQILVRRYRHSLHTHKTITGTGTANVICSRFVQIVQW